MSEHRASRTCGVLLLVLATASLAQSPPPRLPDPTAAFDAPANADQRARGWQLQSTLVSPARRIAVINGRVVREGDTVDGATVLAIEHAGVRLDAGGRLLRLRLFGAGPEDSRGNR